MLPTEDLFVYLYLIRQKVIGALVDSGITVADSKAFLGHDRAVILQLQAQRGTPRARRLTAARVISALRGAGLDQPMRRAIPPRTWRATLQTVTRRWFSRSSSGESLLAKAVH